MKIVRNIALVIVSLLPLYVGADTLIGDFSVAPIVSEKAVMNGNEVLPVATTSNGIYHGVNAAFISTHYSLPFVPGDVNASGDVDVADAVAIANHVMGATPSSFVSENADVNNSGDVDVADVVNLAIKVMGQ